MRELQPLSTSHQASRLHALALLASIVMLGTCFAPIPVKAEPITTLDAFDMDAMGCTTLFEIGTCDRMIASGDYAGSALSQILVGRGAAGEQSSSAAGASPRDYYTKAIETDPSNGEAYLRRGTYLADHDGRFQDAIADLKKALELGEKGAHGPLGYAYCGQRQFDLGFQELGTALESDPKSVESIEHRGQCHELQGERDKAASDYKLALSLNKQTATKTRLEERIATLESGGGAPKPAPSSVPRDPADMANPSVPVASVAVPAGIYRLEGKNPRGDTYFSEVLVEKNDSDIKITMWNGENVLHATGYADAKGTIKVTYTDQVHVDFKRNSDGSLDGVWYENGAPGSERLIPYARFAEAAGVLKPGSYSIVGKDSNGKPASGKVDISQHGDRYRLSWHYDDGDAFDGLGKFDGHLLYIGHDTDQSWNKDAAIIYALTPQGTLAGLYASGMGYETLTPVSSGPAPSPGGNLSPAGPRLNP